MYISLFVLPLTYQIETIMKTSNIFNALALVSTTCVLLTSCREPQHIVVSSALYGTEIVYTNDYTHVGDTLRVCDGEGSLYHSDDIIQHVGHIAVRQADNYNASSKF